MIITEPPREFSETEVCAFWIATNARAPWLCLSAVDGIVAEEFDISTRTVQTYRKEVCRA